MPCPNAMLGALPPIHLRLTVAQALLLALRNEGFTLRTEGPVRRCYAAILPILASARHRTQCTQEDRLKPACGRQACPTENCL